MSKKVKFKINSNIVIRFIGIAVGVLSLTYFFYFTYTQIGTFKTVDWNINTTISFIFSIIFVSLMTASSGYAWFLLVKSGGMRIQVTDAMSIFAVSQFAKYIPGNIGQHVGRVALAKEKGITLPQTVFTIAVESCWVISTASLLAFLNLLIFYDIFAKDYQAKFDSNQFILIGLTTACLPFIIWFIVTRKKNKLTKIIFKDTDFLKSLSLQVLLKCFILYVLTFYFMGIASSIIVTGLESSANYPVQLMVGAFAVAWAGGFLTPGAPAGLGVRETILVKILSPVYGPSVAVQLAIWMRGVTVFADVLTFFIGLVVYRSRILEKV